MPPAARVADPTTHGAPLAPGPGSLNVIIGGQPAWRAMIDQHACPATSVSGADGVGSVLKGSPTVLINNMMACRQGDIVVEKPGLAMGPADPIMMGCPTVIIGESGTGAPAGASGPPVSAASTATPTIDASDSALAATPGTSPEQRTAREKVVRAFYEGREGLGAARANQDLKGIDLDKPVQIVKFPPPSSMTQYVRAATMRPGNFFDPTSSQSPDSMGINGSGRVKVPYSAPPGEGLLSTAAAIKDDWTDPRAPVECHGGGKQLVVDNPTRDRFK